MAEGGVLLIPAETVTVDATEFDRVSEVALGDAGPETAGDAAARYVGTTERGEDTSWT